MATIDRTADRRAITELLHSLAEAWLRGDADAYGVHFTVDATYTTWMGTRYQGRADIVEVHRAMFERLLKGTRLVQAVQRIAFHGPDTAVLATRGDIVRGHRPSDRLTKVQTHTVVREPDGTWRVAAFHNTKRRWLLEALTFMVDPRTRPAAEQPGTERPGTEQPGTEQPDTERSAAER